MNRAEVIVRVAFSLVLAMNAVCALQFIVVPSNFVSAYQLDAAGIAGEAAIRGFGVVFLMWNVTYPLFILKPRKHMKLGIIILVQQLIGCVGESFILLSLPDAGFELLSASILRFIAFDAAGFVIMAGAYVYLSVRIIGSR